VIRQRVRLVPTSTWGTFSGSSPPSRARRGGAIAGSGSKSARYMTSARTTPARILVLAERQVLALARQGGELDDRVVGRLPVDFGQEEVRAPTRQAGLVLHRRKLTRIAHGDDRHVERHQVVGHASPTMEASSTRSRWRA
jgi:hypothetical protein